MFVDLVPISVHHMYSHALFDQKVNFTVSKHTDSILVLSQSDTRFYQAVESAARWSFDFSVFKRGDDEVLGSSSYSYGLTRSVTLSMELQPGAYVVHVTLAIKTCILSHKLSYF